MVLDLKHPSISISRQCELLGLVRSSAYYRARRSNELNEDLMRLIDRQYLETPFYGVRRMTAQLVRLGHERHVIQAFTFDANEVPLDKNQFGRLTLVGL